MKRLRAITLLIAAAFLSTLMGCAKFPTTAPTTGKQLVITLRVKGRINPVDEADPSIRRHYFIAIDNDNNQNTGPWAAVFPPYGGNGWVTSANAVQSVGLTSFLQYDAENPGGYIYNVLPGSYFLNTSAVQPPIRSEILDSGSTLRVIIDFSQIATTAIPAADIQELDINFITTNMLTVSDQIIPDRQWDALGPSGQNYVTVDTRTDRTYSGENLDGPTVTDPDLQIDYWSIEVQTVSSR